MDLAARIAQFENMAQADATNEMAHFSLAGAYVQAGRSLDAAEAYMRCVRLVPDMSKAYQLAGESFIKAGEKARAIEVLTQGHAVASKRGDRMPRDAMAAALKTLGAPVPQAEGLVLDGLDPSAGGGGGFTCQRTGRSGSQLAKPPFKGPVGKWIYENISEQTWQEWIRQGTKVINELRLDLSREQDADTYDRYMREYLGIDDGAMAQLTSKGS